MGETSVLDDARMLVAFEETFSSSFAIWC